MRLLILVIANLVFLMASAKAEDKLNVFACEPEWGALAQEIGGNAVEVYTASTATQNVLSGRMSVLSIPPLPIASGL